MAINVNLWRILRGVCGLLGLLCLGVACPLVVWLYALVPLANTPQADHVWPLFRLAFVASVASVSVGYILMMLADIAKDKYLGDKWKQSSK